MVPCVYAPSLSTSRSMPGHKLPRECVKDGDAFRRYVCPECNRLLKEAVQTSRCGHRFCKSCIDALLDLSTATPARCSQCGERLEREASALPVVSCCSAVVSGRELGKGIAFAHACSPAGTLYLLFHQLQPQGKSMLWREGWLSDTTALKRF